MAAAGDKEKIIHYIEETIPGASLNPEPLDLTAIT
jgi:hypothetical protein